MNQKNSVFTAEDFRSLPRNLFCEDIRHTCLCLLITAITHPVAADFPGVNANGGSVIRLDSFDLSSPEAKWQFQPQAKSTFDAGDGDQPPHWKFVRDNTGDLGRGLGSIDTFPVNDPNANQAHVDSIHRHGREAIFCTSA